MILKTNTIYHTEIEKDGLSIYRKSVAYVRFCRSVHIEKMVLPLSLDVGRWTPTVPSHPAHLIVSIFNPINDAWEQIKEFFLPPIYGMAGETFTETTSMEEMEEYFAKIVDEHVHTLTFEKQVTVSEIKIVCDREHPVWENHGECNGGTRNVPYAILKPLQIIGTYVENNPIKTAIRLPLLQIKQNEPIPPKEMQCKDLPDMLLYAGNQFSIGFSLRRPMLMFLGWDAWGTGKKEILNRLCLRRNTAGVIGGLTGPLYRMKDVDYGSHLWGGSVSVCGNVVTYETNCSVPGSNQVIVFTVYADGFDITIRKSEKICDIPIEFESWRFAWDMRSGLTSTAAESNEESGRNGMLSFPSWFVGDGVGALLGTVTSGTPIIQTESWRNQLMRTDGISIGSTEETTLQFRVCAILPNMQGDQTNLPIGVSRYWGSIFNCYRGELWGFSNHAISTNCHNNQYAPIEIAVHTKKSQAGPDPMALAKYTIGTALNGGGGYGYHRNLYLDSDPILVSMAGRLFQYSSDKKWLEQVESGLIAAYKRIISQIDKTNLVVSSRLSGNSGSHRWSSNAMDVIGFGHLDAYVNAWSYRALRNISALCNEIGRKTLSSEALSYALSLRASYSDTFINPHTGWIAGWKSEDGTLHDYAFIWVNGPALAFGLLDYDKSKFALQSLEKLRKDVGLGSARLGLPCNLLPVDSADQMGVFTALGQPSFEIYTDGGLSGADGYYLRALSLYGLTDEANRLASELDEGYANGMFCGPSGGGQEFLTWEGLPTGYEGTLIVRLLPLYAIAVQYGIIKPLDPEWWPTV